MRGLSTLWLSAQDGTTIRLSLIVSGLPSTHTEHFRIPHIDGLVLRLLHAFKPSFVPCGCRFETSALETRRRAVEGVVYLILFRIAHFLLLFSLPIIALLSLMGGMTGLNALK